MADLPFTPADPELAARLDACLDVEGKIPRALEALGPVAGRDVLLVDGDGGRRAAQLSELGGRVRTVAAASGAGPLAADPASADVVVGLWSTFRAPCPPDSLADADRVLRPGGRILVVHDYGRDDVSRLRGDLPEYGSWSRRDGWFLTHGFRIRVIHCFWTFAAIEEAQGFLADAFGAVGTEVGASLKRPRLSYNVAVYHRERGGAETAG
jgi:SAM-dependent methyltransferase